MTFNLRTMVTTHTHGQA